MGEAEIVNDIFYPPRTTIPSCFNISALENITLELKNRYAHMLPKFTGIEDAYLFLREFKEVCSMMCHPNVPIDTMQLKFIPFALKDDAKKSMYSLLTNSITNWDGFVRVFLRKYVPNNKLLSQGM